MSLKPKGGRYSNTRLVKVYEPWLEYIGHQWGVWTTCPQIFIWNLWGHGGCQN
jgi:hypothetical protein